MTRQFLIIAAIGALAVGAMQLSAQASAFGWTDYDEAEFMMAQKKGKTIVIAVDGGALAREQMQDWPETGGSADVLYVALDSSEQGEFLAAHSMSPTPGLIVFRGMEEIGRVEGSIDTDWIRRIALDAR